MFFYLSSEIVLIRKLTTFWHLAIFKSANLNKDPNYPTWHLIFWISPYFQGLLVAITFTATAFIVSCFTEPDGPVDEKLLVELFQGDSYPQCVRNAFKLKHNVKRTGQVLNDEDEMDDKLLEEEGESKLTGSAKTSEKEKHNSFLKNTLLNLRWKCSSTMVFFMALVFYS